MFGDDGIPSGKFVLDFLLAARAPIRHNYSFHWVRPNDHVSNFLRGIQCVAPGSDLWLTEIELILDQRKSSIPIFRREVLGGWLIVIQYEQILFNCAEQPPSAASLKNPMI